jgi:hypothetical protein
MTQSIHRFVHVPSLPGFHYHDSTEVALHRPFGLLCGLRLVISSGKQIYGMPKLSIEVLGAGSQLEPIETQSCFKSACRDESECRLEIASVKFRLSLQ